MSDLQAYTSFLEQCGFKQVPIVSMISNKINVQSKEYYRFSSDTHIDVHISSYVTSECATMTVFRFDKTTEKFVSTSSYLSV